ncbi:protein TASOR 2 isoform X3 [Melopsittacus undulatus]|uniref:protein TASOR 2 isoform X2 n=1 Tax=Melopsittacus undulatus TaxID=13146 RepID=UPI00146EB95A|nr:protein TASOR 2 isoform X2 [Melopsittacus undulatus]XP_033918911.1 protein TASOR 2 isoform X3 [Melopsittacus undulatus]
MGERRGEGTDWNPESEESSSLLQTAVSVLQSSYLDSTSQDGFLYSQAILVENDVFLRELKAFAQAKEAAGYSQEELEETFAFLLFDNEEKAKEVCQTGLRVNSSSISILGDPAKGVYISKHADCLHPRPWYHGKSGYIVICKLIKGKVKVISENYTTSYTCPSPGYDCHVAMSRSNLPSKTSRCLAFEQSQYYVYEVSGGSTAERPRQICPYIIITYQYREPKEMPVLAIESLPELNHKALHCPWRGQLSIRGQRLCSIALRTPHSSMTPAQLPPNLDINHVMGLSDLKKKLPEAAFEKRNYTGNEVCFQGINFSLYEVEISNKEQYKMDHLIENLKEKDLAIIKYLQDQGFLILLTPSALAQDDGFDTKEPGSLLALFLFTSSQSMALKAAEHQPRDEREESDISLKVASVLPRLRYALQQATSSAGQDTLSPSTWIKHHFQEYAKLDQNTESTSGQSSEVPFSFTLSLTEDECTNPLKKCSEESFSQLQSYLSDSSSYTLPLTTALGCLPGAPESLCCDSEDADKPYLSSVLLPDLFLFNTAGETEVRSEDPDPTLGLDQVGEEPAEGVKLTDSLLVQSSRKKPKRQAADSTRDELPPPEKQMGDSSSNRKAAKQINLALSSEKPASTDMSDEPTLELANLRLPRRRKRGAEILSTVQQTQSGAVQKETSAPDAPTLETKRRRLLKEPEEKVPVAESTTKPVKMQIRKTVAKCSWKPKANMQAGSEPQEPPSVLPREASSQWHGDDSKMGEVCSDGLGDPDLNPNGSKYEPHALNLLADLALGSCSPLFIPADNEVTAESCNHSSDSPEEQQSHHKHGCSCVAANCEYHSEERLADGDPSYSKVVPNQKHPPAKNKVLTDLASSPREKNSKVSCMNNRSKPRPAKPHALHPKKTPKTTKVNKVNNQTLIAAEHSYASQVPEQSKRPMNSKGTSSAAPASTRSNRTGPMVGKVLPFRHQQSSSHPQGIAMRHRSRVKEDFAKTHTVSICDGSITVTHHWNAPYNFYWDSKYTSDPMEKAIVRALHGPWNSRFTDDVQELKLILHVWMALFYSKPRLLSSTRVVVEHSDPKKYVSINTTWDFLDFSDEGEDYFVLEKCPADSRSDPDQTPSSSVEPTTCNQAQFQPADSQTDADGTPAVVDSTVSSSGELPCGEEEPSSTSCPEHAEEKDKEPAAITEEHGHDIPTITKEKPPKEGRMQDATTTPSPADELSGTSKPPAVLGKENPCSQAPNPSSAPWRDAPCTLHGQGQQQKSGWTAGSGNGPGPPKDTESMGDAEHCMEIEDSGWASSDRPHQALGWLFLESSPTTAKPGGARRERRESQNLSGCSEEEVEEAEEEKEDCEYESTALEPGFLAFSASSDDSMDYDHNEQNPVPPAWPQGSGVPVPSPPALASACPGRLTPDLSNGTGTGPQRLPGGVARSLNMLEETLATPDAEVKGVGSAHTGSAADGGSPCDSRLLPPSPSDPSLVGETQPDNNCAPSAAGWESAGSRAGSPSSQDLSLALSSDSSSVCLTPLGRAAGPGAAPEEQDTLVSIWSPSQSSVGGSSGLSQGFGDDADAELPFLSTDEVKQEGNKGLVEEERSIPSANSMDVLASSGASDGQDFAYTAFADGSEAEDSDDVCIRAKESSRSSKRRTVMVAHKLQEPEPSLHSLLEPEPSSSMQEGMSAMEKQQQRNPNGLSSSAHDPPPASPSHGEHTDPHHCLLEWRPVLHQHEGSCGQVHAAEVSVAAGSCSGSLKPRCVEEVGKGTDPCHAEPAESSPMDVPGDLGLMPPAPPHGHKASLHSTEPHSVLREHPRVLSPASDAAPWSCRMDTSPGDQAADAAGSHEREPILPEGLEGGSSFPLAGSASSSSREMLMPLSELQSMCNQGEQEAQGADVLPELHQGSTEVDDTEIHSPPFPELSLHAQRVLSAENLELADADAVSDGLLGSKQLPSKDTHMDSTFEASSSDSSQEPSWSLLTARASCSRSMDAAGTRTNCGSFPGSPVHSEGCSEDRGSLDMEVRPRSRAEHGWTVSPGDTSNELIPPHVTIRDRQGIAKQCRNLVVTRKCQEPQKRHRHCMGQSHLLRSLWGTWRGFEGLTQRTLDMEYLRFRDKLKHILRSGKPPFSTSKNTFPKDFCPQVMSETSPEPQAPTPRSRSPLQVTILPWDTWSSGLDWHEDPQHGDQDTPWQDSLCDKRSWAQNTSQGFHLSKLKYNHRLQDTEGDVAIIFDEFRRVMLRTAGVGPQGQEGVPGHMGDTSEWTCASLAGRLETFEEMITDLCSSLRSHLCSVVKEACGRNGSFYLVETGKEPFFARLKTLLRELGHMETEPLRFCQAKYPDTDRLLVVIRNEDVSSHIHSVPCLLQLKHHPNVVFAGVDSPEDVPGHTYQELFHSGGFVVSDDGLLETVTLGQLKEVVNVLEKLNRSGRWKWLLHYKESKKLREDTRMDPNAHKKYSILRTCQGADLMEVLHYHTCDSVSPPSSEHIRCLLNLQVQHISARFAVYLTETPDVSREVLESKGILVADVNTFLGKVQKVAAPFRRSYW